MTSSKTQPPRKNPFSYPVTTSPRPSATSVAPCAVPDSTYPVIRSFASRVTTGPISLDSSRPGPTLTVEALSRNTSTSASPASPTATVADTAMQRCPAEPNAAAVR